MLTKLAILGSLATLAAADFKIYFFRENVFAGDGAGGAASYSGFKFLTNPPNCADFINGKQLDADFDSDVTDSQRGGAACEGCDISNNWPEWAPSRLEVNDFNQNIFNGEPYHITLYGTGNGGYDIQNTDNVIIGACTMPEQPQEVSCGTGFGPYEGLHFVDCTADITV